MSILLTDKFKFIKAARSIAAALAASFADENATRNNRMKIQRSNSTFGFCLPAKTTLKNQKSYFLPTHRINRNFEKS
jgi:hypothetical protein